MGTDRGLRDVLILEVALIAASCKVNLAEEFDTQEVVNEGERLLILYSARVEDFSWYQQESAVFIGDKEDRGAIGTLMGGSVPFQVHS